MMNNLPTGELITPILALRTETLVPDDDLKDKIKSEFQLICYLTQMYSGEDTAFFMSVHFLDINSNEIVFSKDHTFIELNWEDIRAFIAEIASPFKPYKRHILNFEDKKITIEEYGKLIEEWQESLEEESKEA